MRDVRNRRRPWVRWSLAGRGEGSRDGRQQGGPLPSAPSPPFPAPQPRTACALQRCREELGGARGLIAVGQQGQHDLRVRRGQLGQAQPARRPTGHTHTPPWHVGRPLQAGLDRPPRWPGPEMRAGAPLVSGTHWPAGTVRQGRGEAGKLTHGHPARRAPSRGQHAAGGRQPAVPARQVKLPCSPQGLIGRDHKLRSSIACHSWLPWRPLAASACRHCRAGA